ncbi:MAG: hypothetical protein KA319_11930 [Ferruginibacter sp.]|nr:hypothetical protein [Ferruginibacter sp.]
MIKNVLFAAALITLFSCNNESKKIPTTDTEVATTFIRHVLDDNFVDAEAFVLKDEANMQSFERFKQSFEKKDAAELAQYKKADITINEIKNLGDSLRIIDFNNSYKKEVKQKLKLVWVKDKWLVDLKYTFE